MTNITGNHVVVVIDGVFMFIATGDLTLVLSALLTRVGRVEEVEMSGIVIVGWWWAGHG